VTSETTGRSRSAHATLRGYLYQVCLGVERWLELGDGEVLVCEGDEDLDRRLLGGGGVFEQVKDYKGKLGLGDHVVVETLRHFVRSYVALQRGGVLGRYVFTTTAEPRRRRDGLDFDLLQKWRARDRSPQVCKAVRSLVAGRGAPAWVKEPAAWLDGRTDGWEGFLAAVEWTFGAPDLDRVRAGLRERLGCHSVLRQLPREDILERLVGEVLRRSCRPDPRERTIYPADLWRLAEAARSDLAEWVAGDGLALRRMFLEADTLAGLLDDHTLELRANPTPGQLLTASYEVIPFQEAGREQELADLAEWCNGEGRRDVLLLTGEGGSGKTRLAIEWCRRLRHQGWHAGFLRLDRGAADLDPLLAGSAPRLVVIDYAETRLSVLTDLLYKVALGREAGPKVRLLLLSRRAGDWWEALREGREHAEVGDLLATARQREVTPLVAEEEERRSAFQAAAEAFGVALGRALPKPPEPRLGSADFQRALFLHMAALAALEGKTIGSAAEALGATLVHERRFWDRQVLELRLDEVQADWMKTALGRAIAALTLVQGSLTGAAGELLGRVLSPPEGRDERLASLLKLLRRLYGKGSDLEPLRPDLLGEELVAQELRDDVRLLDRVLDGVTPGEAQKALTILTRLAQRRPEEGRAWLAAAFRDRLEQLAELVFEVAIETGDPVGQVLAQEIGERAGGELARRLLKRYDESGYSTSVPLREVGLAATQKCFALLAESPADDEAARAERARLAGNLGYLLSALGRREEALAATKEAVEHYRALSDARPDAFLPVLARSLNNLGAMLSDLGRREEALAATQEAVEHYRTLSATRPDAFLHELARSLNNLGKMLSDLGRHEEALPATQEAVEHYRALSDARPDAFLPDLARSLNSLGNRLSHLGRCKEALVAARGAVEHYRALSGTRPDAYLPDLALSLSNLGGRLSDLNRSVEAVAATQEAVELRRSLSATRPDVFLPGLARSLNNLSVLLSTLGRTAGALAVAEEAVRTLAPFLARYPDAFREDMAGFTRDYLARAADAGREPDRALLAPLVEPLGLAIDPPAAAPPVSPAG
jgi:tetratricopeptide (TPR) repeat protein